MEEITSSADPRGGPKEHQQVITEEEGIHSQWYVDAGTQTLDTLPAFLNHLVDDYYHDYGTIVHALSAGMMGVFSAINKSPQGGITGFQAGAVFWQIFRELLSEDGPASIRLYEHMLYPQYDYKFDKTITSHTWNWLQNAAKEKLEKRNQADDESRPLVHPDVLAHWQSIVDGNVPFGYTVTTEE